MTPFAIKNHQLDKEITEYGNFDWEAFWDLSVEEKLTYYIKISQILLMRRRSRHIYLQNFPRLPNDECGERRKKRLRKKIFQLAELIDILEGVINQIELQIILL